MKNHLLLQIHLFIPTYVNLSLRMDPIVECLSKNVVDYYPGGEDPFQLQIFVVIGTEKRC